MNFHDAKFVSPPTYEYILCWDSYTGEAFVNYIISNQHNEYRYDDRTFDFWRKYTFIKTGVM